MIADRLTTWAAAALALLVATSAAQAQDPDPPDPADLEYTRGAELAPQATYRTFPRTLPYRDYIPDFVDLAPSLPLPANQGAQGSCVGWAVGYAVRGYYARHVEGQDNRRPQHVPSPAYIFNSVPRDSKCSGGTYISFALDLLKNGSPSLAEYPYNPNRCPLPDASIQSRATRFRIERWFSIDTTIVDQIKGELAQGHPVIFARSFAKSFDRHRGRGVYRRDPGEPDLPGGHAIAIIGFDEGRQAVRIINSWGRGWGDRGYAWMDYAEVTDGYTEAYVMRPLAVPVSVVPTPTPAPAPGPTPVVVLPPIPPGPAPNPQPKPVVVVPPTPAPPTPQPPSPVQFSDLECAKVALVTAGGKHVVRGFVGKDEQLATIKERLQGQAVDIDVAVRPWPQCEALLTLDAALAAADGPQVTIAAPGAEPKKGDTLILQVKAPQSPSHLHVAYIQADGSVVHLAQADARNLQTVDRGRVVVYGDGKQGRPQFVIGAPFGREMVIALASRSPIFSEPRPKTETEREFLTALRRALALRANLPEAQRAVRAAYATLVTKED